MPTGKPPRGGGQRSEPPPPRAAAASPMTDALWEIVKLLVLGQVREGEVKLRELLAGQDIYYRHRHGQQIVRVEQYFRDVNGRSPWPLDMTPQDRQYWQGKLGGLLSELPLARILADLKANPGKQNLVYFLSTDRGARASRWEMLLVTHREEAWQAAKTKEKQDAARFFGQDPLPVQPVQAEWIDKLALELRAVEFALTLKELPADRRREYEERRGRIRAVFEKHKVTL